MEPTEVLLPSELVRIIAGMILDLDKGDRMLVTLTKLVRPSRIPWVWRTYAASIERPLRWSFELRDPYRSHRPIQYSISWTTVPKSMAASLADSEHGLEVMVYGPKGGNRLELVKTRPFWVPASKEYIKWAASFKEYTPGQYTMEVRWNKNIPAYIYLERDNCDGVNGIDSFGTQNVYRFSMSCGVAIGDYYLPCVLSPHIRKLDSFSASGPDFRCRSIEYWDVSRVTSFKNFMRGTVNWRGDLSRWQLPERAIYDGAFIDCAAVAWPRKYYSQRHRPWTVEFFTLYSKWIQGLQIALALSGFCYCGAVIVLVPENSAYMPYAHYGCIVWFFLVGCITFWLAGMKNMGGSRV